MSKMNGKNAIIAAGNVTALLVVVIAAMAWIFSAYVVLAIVGWGVADSGERLAWSERVGVALWVSVPPPALWLGAVIAWTWRRPRPIHVVIAVTLWAAPLSYAIWWLVHT